MQKRPAKKKLPRDANARAFAIGELATGSTEAAEESPRAEAGRKGGLKGGDARAASLTESQRKAIAKKAAAARWKDSTK